MGRPQVPAADQTLRILRHLARRPAPIAATALARDLAVFAEHGWHLDALRALDLFPMTQHVECIARVVRAEQ